MTDTPTTGRRIQIYLPADMLESWDRVPRFERSALIARLLREHWAKTLDTLPASQSPKREPQTDEKA